MTYNEMINGNLHDYKFKSHEVENNALWFKVEEISDLKSRLESALNEKKDIENEISYLKKKIKK